MKCHQMSCTDYGTSYLCTKWLPVALVPYEKLNRPRNFGYAQLLFKAQSLYHDQNIYGCRILLVDQ